MTALEDLAPLTVEARTEIERLFGEGRRVAEVIAHGITRGRENGWRRPNVIALITEKGWTLDSDGRIPRRYRTQEVPPATALPGQAPPEPPRRPVVEFPTPGTVTPGARSTSQRLPPGSTAVHIIAAGKQHPTAAIQRAAEKAEKALDELAALLRDDEKNTVLRNRLAELEAEAARLRAQLGVKKSNRKKPKAGLGGAPSTSTKPIDHGTWGGYLAETARQMEHCAACTAVKDARMKNMQDASAAKAAAARAAREAEST